MGENKPNLKTKTIGELQYRFRIPSYQRGYRWEQPNVEQLLDDIVDNNKEVPYYLQPIVISPAPEEVKTLPEDEQYDYDLIDGQQRLTTVYLILKALQRDKVAKEETNKILTEQGLDPITDVLEPFDLKIPYSLSYETRKSTLQFLDKIQEIKIDKNFNIVNFTDKDQITKNPDHVYIWHAYVSIIRWLHSCGPTQKEKLAKALSSSVPFTGQVKVIWYQLPESITEWKKFTDLNIGKIPLTNSELVKALFLQSEKFIDEEDPEAEEYAKQTLVAQWDQIERELTEEDFWGFLTRESPENYPTRIDLLFDLVSGKATSGSRDKLYTFAYFADKWFGKTDRRTGKNKWEELFLMYQRLRDWWETRSIYHPMGYLISINFPQNALQKLFNYANPTNKPKRSNSQLEAILTRLVKMSLTFKKSEGTESFRDFDYNRNYEEITRYLTLYNIMMTESAGDNLRYPFHKHNSIGGGWSLEHIHAQKSEVITKARLRKEWIVNHARTVEKIISAYSSDKLIMASATELLKEMRSYKETDKRERFNALAEAFSQLLDSLPGAHGLYKDEMGNMALLGRDNNSSLNNSTFDVKRSKIISMMSTNFVPIATERVFMKAISGSIDKINEQGDSKPTPYSCNTEQLFFWGQEDREAYLDDIEVKLKKYL